MASGQAAPRLGFPFAAPKVSGSYHHVPPENSARAESPAQGPGNF